MTDDKASDTQIAKSSDLRVGDKVIGWWENGKERWSDLRRLEGAPLEVIEIDEKIVIFPHPTIGKTWLPLGESCFLIVKRTASLPSLTNYPHHCTRCGRPAYVGLNETDHADESIAKDCPAPRGRSISSHS